MGGVIRKRLGLLVAAVFMVAGCSANHHSIYRFREVGGAQPVVISMDAKQRNLLSTYNLLDANGQPASGAVRRFCSEPSPDVFSVIAQSLGAGGSFGQSADPASLQIALNLAFSSSEQGSTIPRTQTINMLRELMFRTCERYLNGGYDETQLALQAIRDQRLMVSILAIESLTGAIAPRPIIIGASGSAGSGMSGEAVVALESANSRLTGARATKTSAQSAYNAENAGGACDTVLAIAEAARSAEQKIKATACKTKKDTLAAAEGEVESAQAHYDAMRQGVVTGGVSASTQVMAATGQDSLRNAVAVESVAKVVGEIVSRNIDDDSEVLLACLGTVRSGGSGEAGTLAAEKVVPAKDISEICTSYLNAKIYAAEQRLDPYGVAAARLNIQDQSAGRLDRFWAQIAPGGSLNRSQLDSVIAAILPAATGRDVTLLNELRTLDSKAGMATPFGKLSSFFQTALAGGAP